jgi:hypothetical protein
METTEGMRSATLHVAPGAAVGRPAAFAHVEPDVAHGHRPLPPLPRHPSSASQRAVTKAFSPNRAQEQEESK